ncbi:MAG: GNAT family N-acetyltransferase [Pseudomonadota bacterium]
MDDSDAARVFEALDTTWPAAEVVTRHGWHLRRGAGGGKRVSAASRVAPDAPIAPAGAQMRAWGQPLLFMLRGAEAMLDRDLATAGYAEVDPTLLMSAPLPFAVVEGKMHAIFADLPVARMAEVWAAGGIGPARLSVMARVTAPKSYLLVRQGDRITGLGFVACAGSVAMLHAVEVPAEARRQGAGRAVTLAAAEWARRQGAAQLALAVTRANMPARALYDGLGFREVGHYHYRMIDPAAPAS